MKAIVSHVARHHAYETAFALQEVGWLHRYYTSFYSEKNPPLSHRAIGAFLPRSLKDKLSNRRYDGLDESKITSYYFPEIIERTPLTRIIGKYNLMNLKGEIFDSRVSFQNLACDIFHGFDGASMRSFRKSKMQGSITILDQPIFHYQAIREIIIEEYKRFNLEIPSFFIGRDINIRRKECEIEESDYIFVPTDRIADDFAKRGKPRNRVKCVPYGFNPKRFFPGDKKDSVFRILFVGIIGVRKGVYYLLEAVKQLNLKNYEVILVSPIDEEFKPILGRFEGLFKHIDSLPNSELPALYQNASVFVFPSLVEGSAYVTYEAMASGLPVIVSENAGSVARNGKDGFVIPIRDIQTLKEKILTLYESEDLRVEMGQNAANHVKQFTWENYRKKLRDTYQHIYSQSL